MLLLSVSSSIWAQKASEFTPYTVEKTYDKLKKNYEDISPIKPLITDQIFYGENIVYKTADSTELKLDIYIPKEIHVKMHPAVLLIHGGGWLTGQKENQRVMAQHLALNGFIGIAVSYRLGLEAPYPAAVIDIKDAIKFVKKHAARYHINPDKLAVLGTSAGAQLATLVGVTPNAEIYESGASISDDVQAIINVDGIVSFIHPEAGDEGKMASIWLGGNREENWSNWKEASPLEYVNEHTPPTLFINSAQPRFHAGRDDMVKRLNHFNIYNEVHTIPDSPHSFWLVHPWFETTFTYTVNFLNKVF
ncbi:esterase [Tamlana carrageenivorans]|uniref:Esterase n=2 Tax=Pseudotamlana carrageenivorans TaxID=2069432 RepID=A0A2I7SMU7_9FLAO|nr:esterase [Tamlana carrageenivorans]